MEEGPFHYLRGGGFKGCLSRVGGAKEGQNRGKRNLKKKKESGQKRIFSRLRGNFPEKRVLPLWGGGGERGPGKRMFCLEDVLK